MAAVCVVCGKSIHCTFRRLLHPPSSDGSRAVRDFYTAHVNPLLDTSTMQRQFACRQPCFAKLEQAMKHTAKANTFIAELKAMYSGAGASTRSSAVSRSVTTLSITDGNGPNPGGTVAENLGSTPTRPRFGLSAEKTPKRSLLMSDIGAPDRKRSRLELQPATCPATACPTSFRSLTATPETGTSQQHQATPPSILKVSI